MKSLLFKRIPTYHASPKFIAPKHSGLTFTPAVGDKILWKPSTLGGTGACCIMNWDVSKCSIDGQVLQRSAGQASGGTSRYLSHTCRCELLVACLELCGVNSAYVRTIVSQCSCSFVIRGDGKVGLQSSFKPEGELTTKHTSETLGKYMWG